MLGSFDPHSSVLKHLLQAVNFNSNRNRVHSILMHVLFTSHSRYLYPRKGSADIHQTEVLAQIKSKDGKYEQFAKVQSDVMKELKDLIARSELNTSLIFTHLSHLSVIVYW